MNNKLLTLFAAITVSVGFTVHAQTDSLYIAYAKNAITVTNNCNDALRFLDKVSTDGKMTAGYFLYMAKAEDCEQNNEQAIYYYNKYLEFQSGNDSVKKRVAELSDQKTQQARVANQERVAKLTYQSAAKKKHGKKQHNTIEDNFILFGGSYDMALGGANAAYKSGLGLNYSANYSIMHDHFSLGYSIYSGFLFSHNTSWFANVFYMPTSQVAGVDFGLSEGLSFLPAVILVNNHKLALTAGPEIGVAYFYTPEPSNNYGGAASFNDGEDFTFTYGVLANLIFRNDLTFSLEYFTTSQKSVSSDIGGGISQSFPVNRDMLKIGIASRIESWWW